MRNRNSYIQSQNDPYSLATLSFRCTLHFFKLMIFAYQSLGYFILKGKTNALVFTNGSYLSNTLSFCQYFRREGIIQSVADRRKKKIPLLYGKGRKRTDSKFNKFSFPSRRTSREVNQPSLFLCPSYPGLTGF